MKSARGHGGTQRAGISIGRANFFLIKFSASLNILWIENCATAENTLEQRLRHAGIERHRQAATATGIRNESENGKLPENTIDSLRNNWLTTSGLFSSFFLIRFGADLCIDWNDLSCLFHFPPAVLCVFGATSIERKNAAKCAQFHLHSSKTVNCPRFTFNLFLFRLTFLLPFMKFSVRGKFDWGWEVIAYYFGLLVRCSHFRTLQIGNGGAE